jgi:hypothetical protein
MRFYCEISFGGREPKSSYLNQIKEGEKIFLQLKQGELLKFLFGFSINIIAKVS